MQKLYYITVSTRPHPVLDKLKEKVQANGEKIEVLGEHENRSIGWEHQQRFGVKLREVSDYLKRHHLLPNDLILFTDAYDVAYFGNQKELIERYKTFNCPIVFGCEKECHPDPGEACNYHNTDCEFPFLNSGMFIGTVKALRKCIMNYKYEDTDDDQRYWTRQYFDNRDIIALDYTNKLFLNTSKFSKEMFLYDLEVGVAIYKHTSPIFVHVNGPDKTFIAELVGIDKEVLKVPLILRPEPVPEPVLVSVPVPPANPIDVVITVGPSDIDLLPEQIQHTRKNVMNCRNIYLISYDPSVNVPGCITVDERIYPFTLETVQEVLGKNHRNGWYLQQLLKVYAAQVVPDLLDRFVCIDSDAFFVKPIEFVNPTNDRSRCCYSAEYHISYFEHMERLCPSLKRIDPKKSGICHHMVFERQYWKEIIDMVETYHNGKAFYEVFLNSVDVAQATMSGASEFEIYFNYMLQNHSEKIEVRPLIWEDVINWVKVIDWETVVKEEPDLIGHDFVCYHHHLRKGNQWIGYTPVNTQTQLQVTGENANI
jgi:hypothetical protein